MMKPKSLAVILAMTMLVLAGIAAGQAVASGAAPPAIRILAPKAGDNLTQSAVTVQFQLDNPGMAGGSPNFSIQLDDRDPVITAQTSQNFTGLTPGPPTVVVQLVDANKTPISGARAETQFTVTAPAAQPQPARPPDQVRAALPQNDTAI